MNLLYTMTSLIIGVSYGQVMFESEEGSTSFFLFSFNLHWFRLLVKFLDLEQLRDMPEFPQ